MESRSLESPPWRSPLERCTGERVHAWPRTNLFHAIVGLGLAPAGCRGKPAPPGVDSGSAAAGKDASGTTPTDGDAFEDAVAEIPADTGATAMAGEDAPGVFDAAAA